MSLCPYGKCDGSGKISRVEREPEDTRRELGHGLYAGPATTYTSDLCRCRAELEPRDGEAHWWTSETIFEEEWTASVFARNLTVKVSGEIPVSRDNYRVHKRGNRYYPCFVDIGEATFVSPDEARELARLLVAAADACDAYDKPDLDEDGKWWEPQEVEA